MITRIKASNIHSIGNLDLSFEKGKYKYLDEMVLDDKVSNPIAVYGNNGSGKSSMLAVFRYLVSFLTDDPDRFSPIVPNLSERNTTSSSLSIWFELGEDHYEYGLTSTIDAIEKEWLKKNGKVLVERTKNRYLYKNESFSIDAPFYPAIRQIANKIGVRTDVYKVYSFLSGIAYMDSDMKFYKVKSFLNKSSLDVVVEYSSAVKSILQTYKTFPVYDIKSDQMKTGEKYYIATIRKDNGEEFELPYPLISVGMKNQSFLLSVLLSVGKGGVIVVDELESALHPQTIGNFIKVALENDIQLIFSSHNTNVLTRLRPDNIVFANWKNGFSSYKRLSDIYPNIREVNNIEKMYLSSTFDEYIEEK